MCLAVGRAHRGSPRLLRPAAALEGNKFRRSPHAPPRAQGAAFQAPNQDTVLCPPAQTAGEWPPRLARLPPPRAGATAVGQGPPRMLAPPSDGRRTPPICQSDSFVSDPCPAGQSSQPHGVWASPLQSGGAGSAPAALLSGQRAPDSPGGGAGRHSDKSMTNTGIINLL